MSRRTRCDRSPCAVWRAIVLLVIGAAAVVDRAPTGAGAAKTATTARHPKSWDPRLEPIANEVAELRKLDFDHPVAAEFLDDAAFEKKVAVDKGKLTKQDKADIERCTGPAARGGADRTGRRHRRRHELAADLGRARVLRPGDEEDHGEGHEPRRRRHRGSPSRTS